MMSREFLCFVFFFLQGEFHLVEPTHIKVMWKMAVWLSFLTTVDEYAITAAVCRTSSSSANSKAKKTRYLVFIHCDRHLAQSSSCDPFTTPNFLLTKKKERPFPNVFGTLGSQLAIWASFSRFFFSLSLSSRCWCFVYRTTSLSVDICCYCTEHWP